ncbi:hypothetical protein CEXT_451031 [Caerostris extrusa]|uniref:Uncharacterized protein n=1 Tax=Caerostris extrusa TaxID=172846 RepID=A0AAV4MDZ2_CAEEX|nr:hypothetical protein CEXT_451031 [Caerostris extrusa]
MQLPNSRCVSVSLGLPTISVYPGSVSDAAGSVLIDSTLSRPGVDGGSAWKSSGGGRVGIQPMVGRVTYQLRGTYEAISSPNQPSREMQLPVCVSDSLGLSIGSPDPGVFR